MVRPLTWRQRWRSHLCCASRAPGLVTTIGWTPGLWGSSSSYCKGSFFRACMIVLTITLPDFLVTTRSSKNTWMRESVMCERYSGFISLPKPAKWVCPRPCSCLLVLMSCHSARHCQQTLAQRSRRAPVLCSGPAESMAGFDVLHVSGHRYNWWQWTHSPNRHQ